MSAATFARGAPALPDDYWRAACDAALDALEEADYVLVPAEFLPFDTRFAPLEFSWGLEGTERLAWCCSKDDVDRLAPWLLEHGLDRSYYAWSNEVFVLGGNFRWRRGVDMESRRHLTAWFDRLEHYRAGVPARATEVRRVSGLEMPPFEPKVLVVGASNMGNVGDDLLAGVLAELLGGAGADVYLSGPDIDPLRVAEYDAVVVGGGGLIYASRYGENEVQNLGNYLKFGPIGRLLGMPTALIGVGDQDHADGIAKSPLVERFTRTCLSAFTSATTRDEATTELLEQLGGTNIVTGTDLLFAWTDRARRAVKPSAAQLRVALVGEIYRLPALGGVLDAIFQSSPSASALGIDVDELAAVRNGDYDLLIMSDDDVPHVERLHKRLHDAGAAAAIVDLRGRDLESLMFLFGSYAAVITTRFHGYVLAALAGVPVLGFDVPNGKIARLAAEVDATASVLVEPGAEEAFSRIVAALAGRADVVAPSKCDLLAARARVHQDAVHRLLGTAPVEPRSVPRSIGTAAQSGPLILADAEPIPLCWAASSRETDGYANLGDSLSAVIVTGLTGRPVKHTKFDSRSRKLVAVGSIGHAIRYGEAIVWGAGVSIRNGTLAENVRHTRYDIRAVRGPISAQHYRDFGLEVPEIYGDPVWFLPSVFNEPVEKKYELGVIPHIRDVLGHRPDSPPRPDSMRYVVDEADAASVVVINTWHEPTWRGILSKLRLILSCKRIASQSFHGVVIAEAYGIPVLNFRQQIGAKNGVHKIDLSAPCKTDPRVWEFYASGGRSHFYSYSQRRDVRTDWEEVIRAIDRQWEPFAYDGSDLLEAFPVAVQYDPLRERSRADRLLEALQL